MSIQQKSYDQLVILYKDNLNKENIILAFKTNPRNSIYVVDNKQKLIGIITLGSFGRERTNPDNWINYKFKKIIASDNEMQEAEEILKGSQVINTLPVISENGRLLYEYYKAAEDNNNEQCKSLITEEKEYEFNEFLIDSGYKNIAVYGSNSNSIELFHQLKAFKNITVFFISEEKLNCKDIKVIEYHEINNHSIDLILGIDIYEIKLLKIMLDFTEKTNILTLEELLKQRLFLIDISKVSEKLRRKGVEFFFFELPLVNKIKNLTLDEKNRVKHRTSLTTLMNNPERNIDEIRKFVPNEYTLSDLHEIIQIPPTILRGKVIKNADFQNKFINIIDGKRLTTNSPKDYQNQIHIFGPCTAFGAFVEDKYTIQSYLQTLFNSTESKYRIVNHGVPGLERTFHNNSLEDLSLKEGDIVIDLERIGIQSITNYKNHFHKYNVHYYELSSAFDRPHKHGECFVDMPEHTTYIGNDVLANYIFKLIKDSLKVKHKDIDQLSPETNEKSRNHKKTDLFLQNDRFDNYLQQLSQLISIDKEKYIGSIVMNCNPFTYGHRYLIEEASKRVDQLIIFVVEEDKSYFPFKDRLNLVKLGTTDLKNVMVIPSGEFIISSITFPEYFNKDNLQEVKIDMSKDIHVFGAYIAPVLNITKRFVGEEPLDYVTNQYNEALKSILPEYGIELMEIKRKENEDEVISASKVRKLLDAKDFKQIKKIVPATTYDYLIERFSNA